VNISAVGLSASSGGVSSPGNPGGSFFFYKNDVAQGTAPDLTKYIEFTISANPGYVLNLNGFALTFDTRTPGTDANRTSWAVRSSVDGYNANLSSGQGGSGSTWAGATVSFSGTAFNGLSSITLRIYAYDPPPQNEEMYVDNIQVTGLTAVPEPVNLALGVFGVAAIGGYFVRGLRKSRRP